eukprot:1161628-Pelagomonas_calceolata.AAC.14
MHIPQQATITIVSGMICFNPEHAVPRKHSPPKASTQLLTFTSCAPNRSCNNAHTHTAGHEHRRCASQLDVLHRPARGPAHAAGAGGLWHPAAAGAGLLVHAELQQVCWLRGHHDGHAGHLHALQVQHQGVAGAHAWVWTACGCGFAHVVWLHLCGCAGKGKRGGRGKQVGHASTQRGCYDQVGSWIGSHSGSNTPMQHYPLTAATAKETTSCVLGTHPSTFTLLKLKGRKEAPAISPAQAPKL